MLGPIDYVVVGFRGNNFDGSIIRELVKAVDAGVIRIVDLVFIMKDSAGNIECGEYTDQPPELKQYFERLDISSDKPLFTEEDVDKVATQMDNDTAAGVLVLEHLWAKDLKKAIIDAGGMLIADGRIHPEMVKAAVEELEATKEGA
jgi:hypothetical protein